jgi:hypothetical protein
MRHGKPGNWEIGWADGRFTHNAGISDASTAREVPEIPTARALAANGMEPYYFDDEGPAIRTLAGETALHPIHHEELLPTGTALQPFPAGDLLHGFYIHEKRVYA